MVVYRLEHLFGGNQQGGHFPDGHFKVHLRELEQPVKFSVSLSMTSVVPPPPSLGLPFEEAWHAYA